VASDVWRGPSPLDGAPVEVERREFSNQAEQVKYLRDMIETYKGTYTIHALARDIVFRQSNCRPKAKLCHAIALATWVQQNITYCNEGIETFQTPLHTLRLKYGDCDDFSTLIGALVESVGVPVELVSLAWAAPTRTTPYGQVVNKMSFRHIFPRAIVPGPKGETIRVPLDATLDQPVEWISDPILIAYERGLKPSTLVL
jgi:Transglutaminase-like superfamily